MPAKKYRSTYTYTDRDVARLAKVSLNSLRVAKSRGKVNTSNLKSVVEFVIKQRLSNWKLYQRRYSSNCYSGSKV